MLQVVPREIKQLVLQQKMIKNGRYLATAHREKVEAFEFWTKKTELKTKMTLKKSLIQIIDKLWIFRFAFANLL